ncbi:protein kinase domain-containing protein [Pyxidicoccus sp. 3LFB2]
MECPSPTHVGPYRLLHLLGSGGMGRVFAAVHEATGQQVALKLLSPTAAEDPQLVARFLQEARALARLQHPGVVRVFHWDRLGDTAFLAMEHLQGLSLRAWMHRQSGSAPLQAALALCGQIAHVMVDVHAQGIVHRDLKPENVFLCPDESAAPGYRIKLLDFGIAKLPPGADGALTTQVHTHEASFMGTHLYMAPEQFLSASTVDGAADVYALGVLLFELLAGRTPFASEEPVEVISAHLQTEPPPLKPLAPAVPGALSAFIASMLAKNPAERPTMSRCHDMLGRPWEREQDACPVPGLAPFTEAQAELFFGRKAETQALLALLDETRADRRRWVQLEGPSGVGKSSLLQAGVLPRLQERAHPDAPRWLIATLRPSYEPLRNLARALVATFSATGPVGTPQEFEHALRDGPEALRTIVTTYTPKDCRLLLVIEPMEELFTLGAAECRPLDALLSTALVAPGSPLRLLTSLRSDFLHRMEQLPSLARQLHAAARFPLLPMEDEALTEVIRGMARHAGLRLSEGLAERMVKDARGEGGRLPLLGHALRGLWALSAGALLTHEHYERLGGVGGALARQAESLLDGLGEEGRMRAKWLLLELVQVGRGVPDTRRPRSRQEVLTAAGNDAVAEEVLLRLTGMHTGADAGAEQGLRLVMLSGSDPSRQRVDLVHETLLHKVPSLVTWLEQERALLERHADLEVAAHAWEQARYPEEGLPTGTLLAHYRGGPEGAREDRVTARRVSPRAARFLQAAQRLERRRAWGRRGLVAASVLAGLAILFYAVRANQERQRAELAQRSAEQERQRAEGERQRAEENLRQLIGLTNDFVGNSDWKLSRLPYTLDVRQKLLKGFHQTVTSLPKEERPQRDVRLSAVAVNHRLGDLSYYDESLTAADARLDEALVELRLGLVQWPKDKDLLWEMALHHSKRGKVAMARDRWAQARVDLDESVRLMEARSVGNDGGEDYRRSLAVSLAEQGELELEAGKLDESARLFERAISLHQQNAGPYNDALRALTLGFRGEVARRAGDSNMARARLDEALLLARSVVHASPGDQFYRWVLGRVLVWYAMVQRWKGQHETAARSYREAQALGRLLLQGEPPNKRFGLVLAHALDGHEELATSLRLHAQANALRAERCKLVKEFLFRDSQDVRFQSLDCQGAGP